uniref:Alpha/beta hydrolase n=1 Tax=Chaetoceros debilis TaxID=122233 RepID=A0A7S3QCR9_9STRA
MKTKSTSSITLAIFLLQVWSVASAGYFYKGLALTSIDVIKTGEKSEGGNPLVHFDGTIEGRADDKDATFLKNIKEVKDATGKKVLEAEKLTVAQAKAIINQASSDGKGKPLFCIHGFNVQPRTHLKTIKEATLDKFNKGKFMPIPVMWPSEGGTTNYWGDRETTPGAGNGLKILKQALDSFPSKSLLAHSMGNRVLRYAADAKFKFDNIFMVAADVQHNIFNKDYINSGKTTDEDRRELQGMKICSMLTSTNGKPKGKVYVLVNGADFALNASGWNPTTFTPRLGAIGAHYRRNWALFWTEDKKVTHPDIVDCIENVGCNSKLNLWEKTAHSYQFYPQIVQSYQEKHF